MTHQTFRLALADNARVAARREAEAVRAARGVVDRAKGMFLGDWLRDVMLGYTPDHRLRRIGSIGSEGGFIGLERARSHSYWCIKNWDVTIWQPIPDYLATALARFQDEQDD